MTTGTSYIVFPMYYTLWRVREHRAIKPQSLVIFQPSLTSILHFSEWLLLCGSFESDNIPAVICCESYSPAVPPHMPAFILLFSFWNQVDKAMHWPY